MQGGAIDAESAWFNLTDRDTGKDVPFIGTTKGNAALTRVHGGRGTETTSEIFCATDGGYCAPGGRLGASGSVEAKLEALDELLDHLRDVKLPLLLCANYLLVLREAYLLAERSCKEIGACEQQRSGHGSMPEVKFASKGGRAGGLGGRAVLEGRAKSSAGDGTARISWRCRCVCSRWP